MPADIWSGVFLGQRMNQEDWHAVERWADGEAALLIVADGMGGEEAGEVASQTAGLAFLQHFLQARDCAVPQRLMDAARVANEALADSIKRHPHLYGMGTTLLAGCIVGNDLFWLSVGDSRLWLASGGTLHLLNADHSYGAWLDREAADGRLDEASARADPNRNALLSAVMGEAIDLVEVSERPRRLAKGDVVIAASDGLDTLDRQRLMALLADASRGDASEIGGLLLETVVGEDRRYQDNTTVIVARIV